MTDTELIKLIFDRINKDDIFRLRLFKACKEYLNKPKEN